MDWVESLSERRSLFALCIALTIIPRTVRGIIVLVFARSVIGLKNFSFKCSKIVRIASYLKKSARTVRHDKAPFTRAIFNFNCSCR